MSEVIYTPGPTPLILNYGPTQMIITEPVTTPPPSGPGSSNGYWLRWEGALLQNFISWDTAVADSQDDSDSTYGTYTGGNQEQGVYARLTSASSNPPDVNHAKYWIRAKRPAGAGTNRLGFVLVDTGAGLLIDVQDNIDLSMTTSWDWYSADVIYSGKQTGSDPNFQSDDLGLIVRNGNEGSPGSASTNSLLISEIVLVCYA